MQVTVYKREQWEFCDFISTQGRHHTTRIPIPVSCTNSEGCSLEDHRKSLDGPRPALKDRNSRFPCKCGTRADLLELLEDQLDRAEVAEEKSESGCSETREQ